jgi:hypothetical protein
MRASLLFIAVVLLASVPMLAQGPIIDIGTSVTPANVLTLQDVDFVNATTPKWLFTIDLRVRNAGGGNITPVDVVMAITLDVMLANGESFSPASELTTGTFPVEGSRSISNLDLKQNPVYGITYTLQPEAKRRFEELALPTGFMPSGTYIFRIEVTTVRYNQTFKASFQFVLSNPSRLELVFPMDHDRSVGTFPFFQWYFDGPRSRISIFEQLPGQSTPQEAADGVPHATAEVTTNSYLYPSSGVRPLESGKTYVWFVEGLFGVSGNPDGSFKSPYRSFTVSGRSGNAAMQSLLDELERVLGPKHKALFDRIRSEALSPTGKLRLDGATITTTELVKLIDRFRSNPAAVINVDIE